MNKTYNIAEVAEMMGMTVKAIRRFIASGELKSSKSNNTYTIAEKDLKAFKGSG